MKKMRPGAKIKVPRRGELYDAVVIECPNDHVEMINGEKGISIRYDPPIWEQGGYTVAETRLQRNI